MKLLKLLKLDNLGSFFLEDQFALNFIIPTHNEYTIVVKI